MPRYQQVPPRRPTSWAQTLRVWTTLLGAGAVLALLVAWSERLPEPLPASAPADAFSAHRAWPTLAYLADTIGYRVTGTPANDRARAYLVGRLRALPGVEVQEQDAVGVLGSARGLRAYRVRNVLARVRGREPGAVLLSAHYDSPASSVAAADDGVAVAAMLEIARALAQGEPPRHDVILNVNDGEEQGLLGSHAFLRHPWAADVRAFVNLESAGTDGKAILFQAGPGNAWLTRRYAASVPHPYGSVIGQDIFQSGLIPSSTDFEVYVRDGGRRGLDVAFYRGGYAYHTALDRTSAVSPGSVQHMGADALALVRALAAGPLPGDVGGAPSVYYDLLGVAMLAYDHRTALVLAIAATALLLLGLRVALRRHAVPARVVVGAFFWAVVGAAAAIALAVSVAAMGPCLLGSAHGWFAHPLRAIVAYGGTALAALATAQWLFGRGRRARDLSPDGRWVAAWAGALLLHVALLLALTVAGIGSAYLFGWWVLGGAIGGLLLAGGGEGRWRLAAGVGMLPAAVLTLQTATLMVLLFVPVAGRFPLGIPFDLVIAAIVGVCAVVLLAVPVTLLHRGTRVGVAAALAGAVALAGLIVVWSSFPYTARRPQRIAVLHEGGEAPARLLVQTLDHPGPARAVAGVGAWPLGPATVGPSEAAFPAPPLDVAPARLELLAERPMSDGRELDLRLLTAGAYRVVVSAPEARGARWRVAGEPDGNVHEAPRVTFTAAPDSGWVVTVAVRDAAPVTLGVDAYRHAPSGAARDLMARLPRWTSAYGQTVARTRATF